MPLEALRRVIPRPAEGVQCNHRSLALLWSHVMCVPTMLTAADGKKLTMPHDLVIPAILPMEVKRANAKRSGGHKYFSECAGQLTPPGRFNFGPDRTRPKK